MKKLLFFFLFLVSVTAFSQSKEEFTEEKVDVVAQFHEGIQVFRSVFAKNIKVNKIKGKGIFRTELIFIVERDGTISGIKAKGDNESFNQETIKALKKIITKWRPAKVNGVDVRSYYKFPSTANI